MNVIGLTGGIGSGKSTVATIFKLLDVPVYNSDDRAKLLMEQNPEIKNALIQHFGEDVYFEGGSLNRKHLAEIIFENEDALQWINALVHPIVAMDFDIWKTKQIHSFVIKETALLIETLRLQIVDKIIVVKASKALRLSRVERRDQLSESDVLKRMENQIEDEQRIMLADYIIENNGDKSLIRQTLEIFNKIKLMV